MTVNEYIEKFGDDFQFASCLFHPATFKIIEFSDEDDVPEDTLEVGFLRAPPPPYWYIKPDPSDFLDNPISPNADREWLENQKLEMLDRLDKKIEKWTYETGHRYVAILNYSSQATVFKVKMITENAFLIDTETWIPFSVCVIAEGFPPLSQSTHLDFVITLPDWFLSKENALQKAIEKGSVSHLDFELDLKVYDDYRDSVIDNYLLCKGEIPEYDSNFAKIRFGISNNKIHRDNSFYGRVAIIHSLQKRGMEPFPSF